VSRGGGKPDLGWLLIVQLVCARIILERRGREPPH
jgi:hypothetical protein